MVYKPQMKMCPETAELVQKILDETEIPAGHTDPTTGEKVHFEALTELGNLQRFIKRHEGQAHCIIEEGLWRVYNGKYFETDSQKAGVMNLIDSTVRSIYAEAEQQPLETDRIRIAKWAEKSEARQKLSLIHI